MLVADGRGANRKRLALENRKIIKKWFYENPWSTIKACCDATGLTYITVRRHLDILIENEE